MYNYYRVCNDTVAVIIFAVVSFTFLFPCNRIIPLDRRTIAIVGAVTCYLTKTFIFTTDRLDLLNAVDFDVMILLPSIMIINHIIVHLKETSKIVEQIKGIMKKDPKRGFWIVSLTSLIMSPFLTNDGVCLLLVEPILSVFDDSSDTFSEHYDKHHTLFHSLSENVPDNINTNDLNGVDRVNETSAGNYFTNRQVLIKKSDAIYYLLGLACSANIGSCLTYTGNPQNMIVATDSIKVMPSYKFFVYMILPGIFTWYSTIKWIEKCWDEAKEKELLYLESSDMEKPMDQTDQPTENSEKIGILSENQSNKAAKLSILIEDNDNTKHTANNQSISNSIKQKGSENKKILCFSLFCVTNSDIEQQNYNKINVTSPKSVGSNKQSMASPRSPMSPRRKQARDRAKLINNAIHIVTSPFPYMVLILLGLMIIMIFVDIMPISALICVTAMVMIVSVVVGNHWRGKLVWKEIPTHDNNKSHNNNIIGNEGDNTSNPNNNLIYSDAEHYEMHQENLNDFFEELFNAVDYSLLLIFLGLFIVVENITMTGIPKMIWTQLVGKRPFQTILSVVNISVFVIFTSQLLGNVAVIQLAKPNIVALDDNSKRIAWSIISFVATIGGNLTITGSAANIIVAETARKLDPDINIDFFKHFKVCFGVTLVSCVIGSIILLVIVSIDNMLGSNW
eukprot:gene5437-7530_t